jgi:hypothetical protein
MALERWLHSLGYAYVGPTSLYQLTLIEIDRLLQGAYDEHLASSGVRSGDMRKLEAYAKDHGLKVQ